MRAARGREIALVIGYAERPIPVIHAGDKLILSEHTSAIDADLEAVALTSAAIGKGLTVRLKFGSRTVSAIATAPGRASFAEGRTEVYR